jgi:hypothetical protein
MLLNDCAFQVRQWTELNVVMYYGSREDRMVIREHEFYFKNERGHIIAPHMRKGVLKASSLSDVKQAN